MSRVVVGYDADGRTIWRDLGPGSAATLHGRRRGTRGVVGELVQGDPGTHDRGARDQRAYRARQADSPVAGS